MMTISFYDIIGFLSAATVILSLGGIWSQVRLIYTRKRSYAAGDLMGETPTEILSLNRFSSSYIAFFSMFLYALTMQDMNGYIALPRAVALFLTLLVLFEIMIDRRNKRARFTFWFCLLFVSAGMGFAMTPYRTILSEAGIAQAIVIASCLIFAQGVMHQIHVIRKTGRIGALSLRMYQMFFLKDFFAIIFSFLLGFEAGWPVFVMHVTSMVGQIVTIYHFFWVKNSAAAATRRMAVL